MERDEIFVHTMTTKSVKRNSHKLKTCAALLTIITSMMALPTRTSAVISYDYYSNSFTYYRLFINNEANVALSGTSYHRDETNSGNRNIGMGIYNSTFSGSNLILTAKSGTVATLGARGLDVTTNAVATIASSTIMATGTSSWGLNLNTAMLTLSNVTVIGDQTGVTMRGNPAKLVLNNSNISAVGTVAGTVEGYVYGIDVLNGASLEANNTNITGVSGGIDVGLSGCNVHITGGNLTVTNGDAIRTEDTSMFGNMSGTATILVENTVIKATNNLVNNQVGAGEVNIVFNQVDSSNAGGIMISATNSGLTNIAVNGGSGIVGNITNSGSGSLNVTLNNSTLTGNTTVNKEALLNLTLNDSGTWYMVDNSTLTNLTAAKTARVNFPAPAAGNYHTLTVRNNLGGEGGTFAMHTDIAAGKADLLSVGGTASTGAHRISLTNANDNAITGSESPLLLVETAGGSATFTGTTTAGVYDYSVQNGAQVGDAFALPETNWYLYRAGLSNVGNAIIATSAMLGYDWFYSLDALYLRMGDVRQENLTVNREQGTVNSGTTSAVSGNLWVRARGYRLNADASLSGRPFNEYAYGLTAGADKAFHRNTTSTTLLGGFLDAGRIDRDFSGDNANNLGNSNNTGYTNSISAGLYATYLRQNGWHADFILRADRYKHHFDATTADQLPVTGDYSNNALGASLEIGRRLQRADGWWVEPMVQAAYTWLQSADYRTGPAAAALGVTVDSVRAAQYRALVRFGRRIQNSRWLPYGKFGVVKTDLTGGALHIADGANTLFVPDCDGWRVEFGAGTSYLINARSQLYFDYEYDRAPHYERPWALNLGYRYGW